MEIILKKLDRNKKFNENVNPKCFELTSILLKQYYFNLITKFGYRTK